MVEPVVLREELLLNVRYVEDISRPSTRISNVAAVVGAILAAISCLDQPLMRSA